MPFVLTYTHVNRFDTETILRELRPKYTSRAETGGRLPPEQ